MKKAEVNKQGVFQGTMIEESGNVRILGEDLTIGANITSMDPSKWYLYGWIGKGNLIQESENQFLIKNGSGWCDLLYDCTSLIGKTFTVSCEIMLESAHNVSDANGLNICFDRRTNNTNTGSRYVNSTINIKQTDTWIPIQSTFTNLSSSTPYVGFYLRGVTNDASTNGCYVHLRFIKMEEGPVATPWVPNSADAAYSKLGFASANPNIHDPIKAEDFYEI